jgi:DUF1016 N-terminal domain
MVASRVGRSLDTVHLPSGRAAHGKQILVTQSRELTSDYGRGFSYAEVAHMIQFAMAFLVEAIVVTLSQQLSRKTSNPRESEQPLETGCRQSDLVGECRQRQKAVIQAPLRWPTAPHKNLPFMPTFGLIDASAKPCKPSYGSLDPRTGAIDP